MSEYAKNIQTIEDMWKKRIELREEGGRRMSEYIIEVGREDGWAKREEIVRCSDCKNFEPDDEPSEVFPNSYWCDRLTVYMPPDGFCSFGKRKVVGE